ncbi:hypothetical protein OH76DRAFT_360521 [Lentinus brumalis]|uniref:Secreted protein n=1 Tax=Lentinus brumalis TaxID=2498619 RepID=A0A371CJ62_9APHY|nr:hypothetical protein OH76DRAFT_360521 [Polyporus brumalis]
MMCRAVACSSLTCVVLSIATAALLLSIPGGSSHVPARPFTTRRGASPLRSSRPRALLNAPVHVPGTCFCALAMRRRVSDIEKPFTVRLRDATSPRTAVTNGLPTTIRCLPVEEAGRTHNPGGARSRCGAACPAALRLAPLAATTGRLSQSSRGHEHALYELRYVLIGVVARYLC